MRSGNIHALIMHSAAAAAAAARLDDFVGSVVWGDWQRGFFSLGFQCTGMYVGISQCCCCGGSGAQRLEDFVIWWLAA